MRLRSYREKTRQTKPNEINKDFSFVSTIFVYVIFSSCLSLTAITFGQSIKVNPTGVNVNPSSSTTAFLTFGRLTNHRPAEAYWCGDLIPATPALGMKCDPGTIFGSLPSRYDLSRRSGDLGFTDIMSIPPSVARRAYQSAANGDEGRFFYVRRFINTAGGPDEYIAVTCRLAGGGARVPLSLTDVKLFFAPEQPVVLIKAGAPLPSISAKISYNGTGRLIGRWEVAMPGEELPTEQDLLTEASLPIEERSRQRRYTQLSRFNIFLPPMGRITLPGPDTARIPRALEGGYLILLRIEASDDKEADSNLIDVGVGPGIVHSGAVAGFALPVLRYFVGVESNQIESQPVLLRPENGAIVSARQPLEFTWSDTGNRIAKLEIAETNGRVVLSALLPSDVRFYRAPSWLVERGKNNLAMAELHWRITVHDQEGHHTNSTVWRSIRVKP